MKKTATAKVLSNNKLTEGIFDITLECPEIAAMAKAGQFIELYPDNGANLLARPISICEATKETLRIVFQVVGTGTDLFSKFKSGDTVRILGTCGNGYDLKSGSALLVGGGIGVPPLLETAKRLIASGSDVTVVLGFRSGSFLSEEFEKLGAKVYIATDDGSVGFKGNVVDLIKAEKLTADTVYSCGPKIMLKFLAMHCEGQNMPLQVSMEERMACGIGACVGCVVKIKDEGSADGWTFKKVCKDGPVFDSREVCWE
ncbi:MAG: dihydroorotate dehydrogenase electron transfer subunit [Firmicutes bacterium]|nr:dihydroorotate dehydrogenase electron transfer subunit [Bacillota bacterium]